MEEDFIAGGIGSKWCTGVFLGQSAFLCTWRKRKWFI